MQIRALPLVLLLLLLTACAARPPSAADLEAKRFAPLADKAVVYLYRRYPDFSDRPASFTLDGQFHGSTYPGTYYRLELAPGVHRIGGFASDAGAMQFQVEAGRLYFVRQIVGRMLFDQSFFALVNEHEGRDGVLRSELMGASPS